MFQFCHKATKAQKKMLCIFLPCLPAGRVVPLRLCGNVFAAQRRNKRMLIVIINSFRLW